MNTSNTGKKDMANEVTVVVLIRCAKAFNDSVNASLSQSSTLQNDFDKNITPDVAMAFQLANEIFAERMLDPDFANSEAQLVAVLAVTGSVDDLDDSMVISPEMEQALIDLLEASALVSSAGLGGDQAASIVPDDLRDPVIANAFHSRGAGTLANMYAPR